jgi:hypothetical protein
MQAMTCEVQMEVLLVAGKILLGLVMVVWIIAMGSRIRDELRR